MAGYSTSVRIEGRQRANVVGLLRHNLRDVDLANGVEVAHSNEDIDADRTALNVTMVNDGRGGFIQCTDLKQAVSYLDRRIGEARNTRTLKDGRVVPVAIRNDAATSVELILQLDPDFTGDCADMTPEKVIETKRLMQVMVDQAIEEFGGPENVVTWSEHWDEGRPHIQLLGVPMLPNGTLSMKQMFGGAVPGVKPSKLAAQKRYAQIHDNMRTRLQGAGYEATMERVDGGRRHQPLDEFKSMKDRLDAVEIRETWAETAENKLTNLFKSLEKRDARQTRRQKEQDERDQTLDQREAEAARREAEAAQEKEQARRETRDARVRTQQAEQAIAKTEKMNAELERILTAVRADPRMQGVANSLTDTTEKVRKRVVAIKNDIPDFTPETGPELG